jgi:hypothetical protein
MNLLSELDGQIKTACARFHIEDDTLGLLGYRKIKEILRTPISNPSKAIEALCNVKEILTEGRSRALSTRKITFRCNAKSGIQKTCEDSPADTLRAEKQRYSLFFDTVWFLLDIDMDRLQRASKVLSENEAGALRIPPSLKMMNFPVADDADLSVSTGNTGIRCTIDGREVFIDKKTIAAFFMETFAFDIGSPDICLYTDEQLKHFLEETCKETWQKDLLWERVQALFRIMPRRTEHIPDISVSDFSQRMHTALDKAQSGATTPSSPLVDAIRAVLCELPITLRSEVRSFVTAYDLLRKIDTLFETRPPGHQSFPEEHIRGLVQSEINRIQRTWVIVRTSLQQKTDVPPSLMIWDEETARCLSSCKTRRHIECVIDGQKVMLARSAIERLVLTKYHVQTEHLSKVQLETLIEDVSKESTQKVLSAERIQELVRRRQNNVRLFSIGSGRKIPEEGRSVLELVRDYESRPWECRNVTISGRSTFLGTFVSGADQHEHDKEDLKNTAKAYLRQFFDCIEKTTQDKGYIEKLDLRPEDCFYVRADLHGDLASLLAVLHFLQTQGCMDESYRCSPRFHLIFLGDLMDRSFNDIEILTLVLRLLMENPFSVHVARGNHEDVFGMQQHESFDPHFFLQNNDLFSNCYKTFPLALCVGVNDGRRKPQYAFFSHALFSPAIDINPLLEGDRSCMIVEEIPVIQERVYEHRDDKAEAKQHRSFARLSSQRLPDEMMTWEAFRWSVIGRQTGQRDLSGRCILAPDYIHAWMQYVGVKIILKGHEHIFDEIVTRRQKPSQREKCKAIATTLPAGTATGLYGYGPKQTYQGMLIQVAQKVRDWKKIVALQEKGQHSKVSLRADTVWYPVYHALTASH